MVIADQGKTAGIDASPAVRCQNDPVAENSSKKRYVDNGWPTRDPDDHPVSELASDRVGPLSPYGDLTFPLPASSLPYLHPVTVVNR